MRKLTALLVALALCVALFGCSSGDGGSTPTTDGSSAAGGSPSGGGETAGGGSGDIMVCIASDPKTIDPALNASVDGSTIIQNAFSGLYAWADDGSGRQVVVADCAEEVVQPTEIEGGKFQYVITLKEGLKWSDGVEMKASDFTYAWNRAVDPATLCEYQYIFDVLDGYDAENPSLNIAADDEARTVTVVTSAYCAYFDQLMAFPTYFPVRQDIVEAGPETWATAADTYVSNGAFKMTDWTVGSYIKFEKNENYWNAGDVNLNSLTFALSDDSDAMFANFENGTYQFIRNLPVAQIPILKETRLDQDFFIGDYIGVYYIEFNVEESFKPGLTTSSKDAAAWDGWSAEQNAQVRHALGLLIDRNYIVDEVTMSGEKPANGFVPAGMDDGTGTEFREKADSWWSVDPADYDANCDQAVEILKQWYDYDEASGKFTNFPSFEFSMNPTSRNLAIIAAIQNIWSDYGIESTVDQRTWSVIQTALVEGDFTASRLGWIADYNDPITFLEIFVSASGNNHPRLGKDGPIGSGATYGPNKNQTWADAYESLITQIKTTSDMATRAEAMYQAETVLREVYPMLPLYFYTEPYMSNPNLQNYVYSPLGFILFRYATYSA